MYSHAAPKNSFNYSHSITPPLPKPTSEILLFKKIFKILL